MEAIIDTAAIDAASEAAAENAAGAAGAADAAKAVIAAIMAHATIKCAPYTVFVASKYNVRTKETDISELKALIRAFGVVQNLIGFAQMENGVPTGRIAIVGGLRRLRCVCELVAEGDLPPDFSLNYLLVTEAEAIELSLAENSGRAQMHPADVFEAMLAMTEAGRALDDIALSFHLEVAEVRRRLKLARIAPRLLDLYRQDQADFQQMMALAISDDHAAQEQAWDSFGARYRAPHELRRLLTEQKINLQTDRVARYVGTAAYEKAGGLVTRDLFSGTQAGYLDDVVLLEKLAQEKAHRVRKQLLKEGLRWVEIILRPDHASLAAYARVAMVRSALSEQQVAWRAALEERIAQLEQRMAALDEEEDPQAVQQLDRERSELVAQRHAIDASRSDVPDPASKVLAGAVVMLDDQGKLVVRRDLIRPEDQPQRGKQGKAASSRGGGNVAGQPAKAGKAGKPRAVHSERLVHELSSQRTLALQAVLMDSSDVALRYLTFTLMRPALCGPGQGTTASLAKVSCTRPALADIASSSKAAAALAQRKTDLLARLPAERSAWMAWLQAQPQAAVLEVLAYCVALTLDATQLREGPAPEVDVLAAAVQLDMAQWWCASAANYFAHVSKERVLQVVAAVGGARAAVPLENLTKAAAAEAAERAVASAGWLPELLRPLPVPVTAA